MAVPPVSQDIAVANGWSTIAWEPKWYWGPGPGIFPAPTPTAPINSPSPGSYWTGHWEPNNYATGHGIGNFFTYPPQQASKVYLSIRMMVDPNYIWHPISNKFINLEYAGNHCDSSGCVGGQVLVQLNEGGNWLHAEQEYTGPNGANFYIDNDVHPGEVSLPGQLDNAPISRGEWHHIEVLVDLPGHVFKVWLDGTLKSSANPTFAVNAFDAIAVNAHRGGGGENLTQDLYWYYDHIATAYK